jgi:hypothetical protein
MEQKLNITFAPGCFDEFEGSQEELDEFIKLIQNTIQEGFDDGSLLDSFTSLDIDDLGYSTESVKRLH